jgi:hypothetical protein
MGAVVPITARFSEDFYDRLGHGVADELVAWFNQVDSVYRSEFRELFDTNFRSFDAKLEHLRAELSARMANQFARLDTKIDGRCNNLELELDRRCDELDAKIDRRYDELGAKMDRGFKSVRTELQTCRAEMRAEFSEVRKDTTRFEARMTRWTFLMWLGTLGTVIALLKL